MNEQELPQHADGALTAHPQAPTVRRGREAGGGAAAPRGARAPRPRARAAAPRRPPRPPPGGRAARAPLDSTTASG
ncbi:hypothetical protein, partial [Streptomyces sp. NPDC057557]|uniref:hypothetical protein n=1 Tax=Streptomyces sp. NPDC057557 TaxID=3346167 RepID=UPI003673A575